MQAFGIADLFLKLARAEKAAYERAGYPITPDVERELVIRAKQKEAEFIADRRTRGIPAGLAELLNAKRKKLARAIAQKLVLASEDFALLVFNHAALGFTHSLKSREHVPDHLARGPRTPANVR